MCKKRKRDTKKTTHLKMKICVVREGENKLIKQTKQYIIQRKEYFHILKYCRQTPAKRRTHTIE